MLMELHLLVLNNDTLLKGEELYQILKEVKEVNDKENDQIMNEVWFR
jgi:hypothetical protein